jgi:uncharacterized protein
MSQANVEMVRRVYDAAARGDNDAPFDLYAPDIEWDFSARAIMVGREAVYHGHEGVRRCWRDYLTVFERLDFELEQLIDAGDQVLAIVRERSVGRLSQVAVDTRVYAVWALRAGKIVRMRGYIDRSEALEAVGLSE